MPNAGPNADYWKDAAYGVTTEAEARAAVRELAAKKVDIVKIWVDDRNKTVTPLPPSLYRPIIDEAHARGLRVVAHVYYLADAKELLRAGIDGFAHGIRDLEVDEEIMALFKQRPQVFVIPNLPDTPPSHGRSRLAQRDASTARDRGVEAHGRRIAGAATTLRGAGTQSREALGSRRAHRVRHRRRRRRAVRLFGARRARRHGRRRHDAGAGASSPRRARRPRSCVSISSARSPPARAPTSSSSTPTRSTTSRNTRRISRVYLRGAEVNRAQLSRDWTK